MLLADVAAADRHRPDAQGKGEERLPHRVERGLDGMFHEPSPIGSQVEVETFRRAGQGDRPHDERAQKDEKRNHHPLRHALDPPHHAEKADDGGKRHHAQHVLRTERLVREKSAERRGEVLRGGGVRRIVRRVFHEPPGHVRVVDHQHKAPGGDQKAHLVPEALRLLRRQQGQRLRHATPGGAPVGEFGRQQGKPQQQQEGEIHQYEGRPAVLAHDVRKTPYVAESDGTAGRHHQEPQPIT